MNLIYCSLLVPSLKCDQLAKCQMPISTLLNNIDLGWLFLNSEERFVHEKFNISFARFTSEWTARCTISHSFVQNLASFFWAGCTHKLITYEYHIIFHSIIPVSSNAAYFNDCIQVRELLFVSFCRPSFLLYISSMCRNRIDATLSSYSDCTRYELKRF